MLRWFLILSMMVFSFDVFANDSVKSKEKKRYELSICAIIQDESLSLREWIEYHRLVGVDHFFLYYHGKRHTFKQRLLPFIKSGLVTFIPWQEKAGIVEGLDFIWPLSVQIPAYENAVYVTAASKTRWLICMDINEYLVPVNSNNVTDVLKKYSDSSGLILSSDCFNSSKMSAMPEIQLVIENRDLVTQPEDTPFREVKKMIFKPEACHGFVWPPYQCRLVNANPVEISRSELRVNRYVYRGRPYLENLKRKSYVDNRILSETEVSELLKRGNEIEDQERVIERFIPALKKKIGLR